MNRIKVNKAQWWRPLVRVLWAWGLELAIVAVGLWLRYRYAVNANMVDDEYFEALALHNLIRTGLPVFESGALHPRGWVFLASAVPVVFALGTTKLAMRLVNLLFDAALVALVVYIGRRRWHRVVGMGGGLAVALLPTLIENTPRVRFYGAFVLFSLLTVWTAFRASQAPNHVGRHIAFAVAFGLAIMAHEEALLLYPPLLLLLLLWGGRAYWRRRSAWGAHLIILAVTLVRAGLEVVANLQAPAFIGVQGEAKPYLEPFVAVAEKWMVYRNVYLQRAYWPVTAAFVITSAWLLVALWARVRSARARFPGLLAFLVVPVLWSLFFLVVLAGSNWRESRYTLFVEPLWALAAAAGLWWLLEPLSRLSLRRGAYAVWLLAVGLMLWPKAWAASSSRNADYVSAFAHVAAERRPGDVVGTPLIHVCAFLLPGGCDYYLREDGYEPYVIERAGVLVDRWTGSPLLSTPEEMERLIRSAPRVWVVANGHRLGTRYRAAFRRLLLEQLRLEAEYGGGMRVAVAEGWRPRPDYTVIREMALPVGPFTLVRLERTALEERPTGSWLHLVLHWQIPKGFPLNLNSSVKLVSSAGENLTQSDGPPANGLVRTGERPNLPLPDFKQLRLPDELPAGIYRLEVSLYDPTTLEPAGESVPFEWLRVGPLPAPPRVPVGAVWQNGLVLVGHGELPDRLVPGDVVSVTLTWAARRPVAEDLTLSVQLIGPEGSLVAQDDHPPLRGFYPTSRWVPGETVLEETYTLVLPEALPPGPYRLVVLWYEPSTLRRVPVDAGDDALEVARWTR